MTHVPTTGEAQTHWCRSASSGFLASSPPLKMKASPLPDLIAAAHSPNDGKPRRHVDVSTYASGSSSCRAAGDCLAALSASSSHPPTPCSRRHDTQSPAHHRRDASAEARSSPARTHTRSLSLSTRSAHLCLDPNALSTASVSPRRTTHLNNSSINTNGALDDGHQPNTTANTTTAAASSPIEASAVLSEHADAAPCHERTPSFRSESPSTGGPNPTAALAHRLGRYTRLLEACCASTCGSSTLAPPSHVSGVGERRHTTTATMTTATRTAAREKPSKSLLWELLVRQRLLEEAYVVLRHTRDPDALLTTVRFFSRVMSVFSLQLVVPSLSSSRTSSSAESFYAETSLAWLATCLNATMLACASSNSSSSASSTLSSPYASTHGARPFSRTPLPQTVIVSAAQTIHSPRLATSASRCATEQESDALPSPPPPPRQRNWTRWTTDLLACASAACGADIGIRLGADHAPRPASAPHCQQASHGVGLLVRYMLVPSELADTRASESALLLLVSPTRHTQPNTTPVALVSPTSSTLLLSRVTTTSSSSPELCAHPHGHAATAEGGEGGEGGRSFAILNEPSVNLTRAPSDAVLWSTVVVETERAVSSLACLCDWLRLAHGSCQTRESCFDDHRVGHVLSTRQAHTLRCVLLRKIETVIELDAMRACGLYPCMDSMAREETRAAAAGRATSTRQSRLAVIQTALDWLTSGLSHALARVRASMRHAVAPQNHVSATESGAGPCLAMFLRESVADTHALAALLSFATSELSEKKERDTCSSCTAKTSPAHDAAQALVTATTHFALSLLHAALLCDSRHATLDPIHTHTAATRTPPAQLSLCAADTVRLVLPFMSTVACHCVTALDAYLVSACEPEGPIRASGAAEVGSTPHEAGQPPYTYTSHHFAATAHIECPDASRANMTTSTTRATSGRAPSPPPPPPLISWVDPTEFAMHTTPSRARRRGRVSRRSERHHAHSHPRHSIRSARDGSPARTPPRDSDGEESDDGRVHGMWWVGEDGETEAIELQGPTHRSRVSSPGTRSTSRTSLSETRSSSPPSSLHRVVVSMSHGVLLSHSRSIGWIHGPPPPSVPLERSSSSFSLLYTPAASLDSLELRPPADLPPSSSCVVPPLQSSLVMRTAGTAPDSRGAVTEATSHTGPSSASPPDPVVWPEAFPRWQHPLRQLTRFSCFVASVVEDLLLVRDPTFNFTEPSGSGRDRNDDCNDDNDDDDANRADASHASALRWFLRVLQSRNCLDALWRAQRIINDAANAETVLLSGPRRLSCARQRLAHLVATGTESAARPFSPLEHIAAEAVQCVSQPDYSRREEKDGCEHSETFARECRVGDLSVLVAATESNWLHVLWRLFQHDPSLAYTECLASAPPLCQSEAAGSAAHSATSPRTRSAAACCRTLWATAAALALVCLQEKPPRSTHGWGRIQRLAMTSRDISDSACQSDTLCDKYPEHAAEGWNLSYCRLLQVLQMLVAAEEEHLHVKTASHSLAETEEAPPRDAAALAQHATYSLTTEQLSAFCDLITDETQQTPHELVPRWALRALLHAGTTYCPHGHAFLCPLWSWPPPMLRRVLGEVLCMSSAFEENETMALTDMETYRHRGVSLDEGHPSSPSSVSCGQVETACAGLVQPAAPHLTLASNKGRRSGQKDDTNDEVSAVFKALETAQQQEAALVSAQVNCLRALRPPAYCPRTFVTEKELSSAAASGSSAGHHSVWERATPPSFNDLDFVDDDVSQLFPPRSEGQPDLQFLASELSILDFIRTVLSFTRAAVPTQPQARREATTAASSAAPRATTRATTVSHPIFALYDQATMLLETATPPLDPCAAPVADEVGSVDEADTSTHTIIAPFMTSTNGVGIARLVAEETVPSRVVSSVSSPAHRWGVLSCASLTQLEASAIWLSAAETFDADEFGSAAMDTAHAPFLAGAMTTTMPAPASSSSSLEIISPHVVGTTQMPTWDEDVAAVSVRTSTTRRAVLPGISTSFFAFSSSAPSFSATAEEGDDHLVQTLDLQLFGQQGYATSAASSAFQRFALPPTRVFDSPAALPWSSTASSSVSSSTDAMQSVLLSDPRAHHHDDANNSDDDDDRQADTVPSLHSERGHARFTPNSETSTSVNTPFTTRDGSLSSGRLEWQVRPLSENAPDCCVSIRSSLPRPRRALSLRDAHTHQLVRCLCALEHRVQLVEASLRWLHSAVTSPDFCAELLLRREWAFVFLRLCRFLGLAMNRVVAASGTEESHRPGQPEGWSSLMCADEKTSHARLLALGAPAPCCRTALTAFERFQSTTLQLLLTCLDVLWHFLRITTDPVDAMEDAQRDDCEAADTGTSHAHPPQDAATSNTEDIHPVGGIAATAGERAEKMTESTEPQQPQLVLAATTTYYPVTFEDSAQIADDTSSPRGTFATADREIGAAPPSETRALPPREAALHCEIHATAPRALSAFSAVFALAGEAIPQSSTPAQRSGLPDPAEERSRRRRRPFSGVPNGSSGAMSSSGGGTTSQSLPQFSPRLAQTAWEQRAHTLYMIETFLLSAMRRELRIGRVESFTEWWGHSAAAQAAVAPSEHAVVAAQLSDVLRALKDDEAWDDAQESVNLRSQDS